MLDQLRLESCCCRMRVTTAVSILGWKGIIISVMVIIAGILETVVQPVVAEDPSIRLLALEIFLPIGLVMISIFLILLIMNIFLVKRNRANSFGEVKSIIQVICKLLLSLELILSLGLLITMTTLILLMDPIHDPIRLSILIGSLILGLVWMIFVCIAIHGIRKSRKSLLRVNMIFSLVVVLVQIVLEIISIVTQRNITPFLVGVIPGFLVGIVYFFFHIGYFMVLYNIMDIRVDNSQEMKAV